MNGNHVKCVEMNERSASAERIGFLDKDESATLRQLVHKSLKNAHEAALQSNPYWYPLCCPSYGTEEAIGAIDSMLRCQTTMAGKVRQFEEEFSRAVNAKHAIMVNSGSSADLLMCVGLTMPSYRRLKAGDEVLVPALTWPTQIWSAVMAGLNVRMIDVDPLTFNASPEIIERSITDQTKGLFIVHLLGNACEMTKIHQICDKHGIVLIEDACAAFGSTYDGQSVGTFGLAGAFSFFFSHQMTTMEGGMIITNDDRFADCVRVLRAHGWTRNVSEGFMADCERDRRFTFLDIGFNLRPTEIQGAFGLEQLKRQPTFKLSRQLKYAVFEKFVASVPDLEMPRCPPRAFANWMLLAIVVKQNDKFTKHQLVEFLERNGIETRPISGGNVTKQPFAKYYPFLRGEKYSGVEQVDLNAFTVGLYPNSPFADPRSCADVERVIECMTRFLKRKKVTFFTN